MIGNLLMEEFCMTERINAREEGLGAADAPERIDFLKEPLQDLEQIRRTSKDVEDGRIEEIYKELDLPLDRFPASAYDFSEKHVDQFVAYFDELESAPKIAQLLVEFGKPIPEIKIREPNLVRSAIDAMVKYDDLHKNRMHSLFEQTKRHRMHQSQVHSTKLKLERMKNGDVDAEEFVQAYREMETISRQLQTEQPDLARFFKLPELPENEKVSKETLDEVVTKLDAIKTTLEQLRLDDSDDMKKMVDDYATIIKIMQAIIEMNKDAIEAILRRMVA